MASNPIENLKGTWDMVSAENFEAMLKELGVNKLIRTMVKNVKPRVTIGENNGKWSFKSESTFKSISYDFEPSIQFNDTSPDGQPIKVIIRFENGKWIQTVYYENGKIMNVERWVDDQDQLHVINKLGDVTATQLFKRSKK